MNARGAFATLVLATLFVFPTVSSAAIVQKWQTTAGVNYSVLAQAGDLNEDGTYELITGEIVSANVRIAIRSGASGALLAQTALSYDVNDLLIQNIDADNDAEIIVWDSNTGKFNCFEYNGSSTLAVRWSFLPAVAQPFEWTVVDFDGNGLLYLVFMDAESGDFVVYNVNGALVSTVFPGGPTFPGWGPGLYVADYDSDEKMELLIDYHNGNSREDRLYLYQSSTGVAVEPGMTGSPSVTLGPSYPNPTFSLSRIEYSVPTTGPASLRLFDVMGREVRTLVDGSVPAGRHDATWDGRDANGRRVPAGAYFYQLNVAGQRASQRVVQLP